MNACFADTFYFLALLHERDSKHDHAMRINQSLRVRLVTTDWVLTEVGDALASPPNRMLFVALVERLRTNSSVSVVPFEQDLFEDALRLYARRPDKEWTVTDCVSFVVMKRDGITDALTGDQHFEQAGFRALMR
jgi:uncharacterized protein